MVNIVVLVGNLTQRPELKYTASGTGVATLRLAVNRKYSTSTGEKREEVLFIDVVSWGRVAENCAEYLDKGSKILVEGYLRSQDWQGRDGARRTTYSVNASRVQFLSFKEGAGNGRKPVPSEVANDDTGTNDDVPF